MSVSLFKEEHGVISYWIEEKEHYGEADQDPIFRMLQLEDVKKLKIISKKEMSKTELDGLTKYQVYTLQDKRRLVFKNEHDSDWSTSGFRAEAHATSGPFLMID